MPAEIEPFKEHITRLAKARGLTLSKLKYRAYEPEVEGTSPSTFDAVTQGRRPLTPVLIEAIARALEVEPTEFAEYRLAQMREALDERVVGLAAAVASVEAIERAVPAQGNASPLTRGLRIAQEKRRRRLGLGDVRRPSADSQDRVEPRTPGRTAREGH